MQRESDEKKKHDPEEQESFEKTPSMYVGQERFLMMHLQEVKRSSNWLWDRGVAGLFLTACLFVTACGEFQGLPKLSDILSSPNRGRPLSERTLVAGLKEALRVGAKRAVLNTSRSGGFMNNALIRIVMPQELATMATAVRTVGLGHLADRLEVAMNEAAEKASGEANAVLWKAVSEMTVTDAVAILEGHNHAATDYFRERASDTLKSRFRPIVDETMNDIGLYRQYQALVQAYKNLPFTSMRPFDLGDYVTEKGLNGVFAMMAKEEEKIRKDPIARTTQLLQQVFGAYDGNP